MTAQPLVVLGVDPGGRTCGLVVRCSDALGAHLTVLRDPSQSRQEWIEACLDACEKIGTGVELVAVEDINPPSPHIGHRLIDPTPVIETGVLAGAVYGMAWAQPVDCVLVPPGHNGQGHITAYPEPLQPTRGKGAGHDNLRHCRSAWDVAGVGALLHHGQVVQ